MMSAIFRSSSFERTPRKTSILTRGMLLSVGVTREGVREEEEVIDRQEEGERCVVSKDRRAVDGWTRLLRESAAGTFASFDWTR